MSIWKQGKERRELMSNIRRKMFLGAVCMGMAMFVACGSPDRNADGNSQNGSMEGQDGNSNDTGNNTGNDMENTMENGTESHTINGSRKTGLLENASPDTCALALYYYDGETMAVKYQFDTDKEKEILQQFNELPYETADLEKLNDWQVPCYGLEISDTDGMDLCVAYADGLWLNQNWEVYSVEADFQSIWEGLGAEEEDIGSIIAFPNAGILCRYDRRFLEEISPEDEYGIATLPLEVNMTVTEISNGVVTAVIDNQSGQEIMYGEDYSLRKKIDGKWYDLPLVKTNIGFNAVGIYLPDLEQHTVTCDLKIFGELEEGEYMLVKSDGLEAEFSLDGEGNLK